MKDGEIYAKTSFMDNCKTKEGREFLWEMRELDFNIVRSVAAEKILEKLEDGHTPCPCLKMSRSDCEYLLCSGAFVKQVREEFGIEEDTNE